MRRFIVSVSVATAVVVATPSSQAPPRHFLWTVTAPGAPPSYLMGSLHVLTPDYYPLGAPIEKAFQSSQVLITEADLDEVSNPATVMGLMTRALLPDGQTLDRVIAAGLYAEVMQRADKAAVPRAAVQRLKPWMVALVLTTPALQEAGFKPEHGIDKHFFERAKKAGTERRALETVAFQFDRLDQMTMAQQEAMLRSTLQDLETQTQHNNVKAMADAWSKGNTEMLAELLLTTMKASPDLYQRLLVERNASWVESVEACVKQKTSCFVVVGAAHLVGDDSLVAMLQKKGYKVEQQ